MRTTLPEWLQARIDERFTYIDISGGVGTSARVVQANEPEGGSAGETAVLLDDGTVVSLPRTDLRCWSRSCVFALGAQLAVVAISREGDVELWVLDPGSSTWSAGPDLGFARLTPFSYVTVELFDDEFLVRQVRLFEDPSGHGVVVGADLTVRPTAEPPPGIPMGHDTLVGGYALLLGYEYEDNSARFPQPWAYDVANDSWAPVPNPTWIECVATETCDWVPVGDPNDTVVAATTTRLVVEVAEGDLGMLDPATMTWVDIGEPPFEVRGHHTIAIDDDTLISMPTLHDPAPPETVVFGVLDLDADTWVTSDLPGIEIGWNWTTITTPDSILLATSPDYVTATAPDLALDRATMQFRPTTPADDASWLGAFSGYTVDIVELMGALGATVSPPPPTTLSTTGSIAELPPDTTSG